MSPSDPELRVGVCTSHAHNQPLLLFPLCCSTRTTISLLSRGVHSGTMAVRLSVFPILLVVSIRYLAAATCPNITATELCKFCEEKPPLSFRYQLSCNYVTARGAAIADITSLVRSESSAENFTELLFSGFQDQELTPETFVGFTSLGRLEIAFSQVEYIGRNTFGSLPSLHNLILHNNDRLKWLSGESFSGLNSLESLELSKNSIKHLREDLEPFFLRISDSIVLRNLQLQCDCHLLWLVDFIANHSDIVTADEVDCSNSDLTQCLDPCQLGYHPCHEEASCSITNGPQPVCSCNPCYSGDGVDCTQTVCPSENMVCMPLTGECECGEDFTTGDTDLCTRIVSEVFTNLTRDCSEVEPEDLESLSYCAEMLSQVATHHLTMPEEIPRVVDLLQDIVASLSQPEAQPPSFNISQNLVEAASQLLNEGNLGLWQNTMRDSTRDTVAIFSAMNDLGALLLTQTNITNITTDNIAMVLVRPNCQSDNTVPDFDGYDISSDLLRDAPEAGSESTLSLPSSLFSDVFANGSVAHCSEVGVVSLVYGGIGPRLSLNEEELLASIGCSPNSTSDTENVCPWYGDPPVICPTDWQVNSVVISATVINSSEAISTQLSSPVTISLSHQDPSLSSPVCAFIDESLPLQSTDSWLTENCERDEEASSDTTTVCNCYHLTSFALVMSRSSSPSENRPLSIATKVGLSLSILCLLATVILLFGLKLKNKTLHQVHRQLALALGFAQLVFLVGVDRSAVPSPDQLCTAWAALLHYLLLATFLWQLCEGIHLYLLIGKVFGNFERVHYIYSIIAWGLPLLIVGPTLGLKFCDYGSTNYCWISPDGDAIWAFHGPVIAVLLINVVVLVYVVTVIMKLSMRKEENACLLITLIHASVVLVPILGVTWALGFLVVGGGIYATVVEWLFFVFTTLQGVAIFFAHCIINREVRSTFLHTMGCRKLAQNQDTMVNVSRKLSTAQFSLLRRNSGQTSRSTVGGGVMTPTATPSRRESETENPFQFSLVPIKEESSSHESTTKEYDVAVIEEETCCHGNTVPSPNRH